MRVVIKEGLRRAGVTRLCWRRKLRALRPYGLGFKEAPLFVLADPEIDNFTYDLANWDELRAWLTGTFSPQASLYVDEFLEAPSSMIQLAARRARWAPAMKSRLLFNYRVGWYAIARHLRPRSIVETGTHHGLGALVLLDAVHRNADEGAPGTLYSIDPRPGAGWLVPRRRRDGWQRVAASSEVALERIGHIDLFIHDTVPELEALELKAAQACGARVLITNVKDRHQSALPTIAEASGWRYTEWRERPVGHWYPGGGIGLALRPAD